MEILRFAPGPSSCLHFWMFCNFRRFFLCANLKVKAGRRPWSKTCVNCKIYTFETLSKSHTFVILRKDSEKCTRQNSLKLETLNDGPGYEKNREIQPRRLRSKNARLCAIFKNFLTSCSTPCPYSSRTTMSISDLSVIFCFCFRCAAAVCFDVCSTSCFLKLQFLFLPLGFNFILIHVDAF